jgi:hypothetical protein
MTMPQGIHYINFVPVDSARLEISEAESPMLQLGIEKHSITHKNLTYYQIRIGSTFGRNGFQIERGRVEMRFRVDQGKVSVHDLFPRRTEEKEVSELEIGLSSDMTWGVIGGGSIGYKTRIHSINTVLSAGGLLDSVGWWRFNKKRGDDHIEGAMETLLTLQSETGSKVSGRARLEGKLTGLRGEQKEISFTFIL